MQESTRDIIKKAFIRLYQENQFEKISVKMICQEAHVSRTTFYAYFGSISEILREIEDGIIRDLFGINEGFKDFDFSRYKKGDPFPFFEPTLSYIQENMLFFRVLLSRGEPYFIYQWKKIIKHHFREKFLYDRISLKHPELILEMIASSVIGVYTYWVLHPEEITAAEVGNEALPRIIWDLMM